MVAPNFQLKAVPPALLASPVALFKYVEFNKYCHYLVMLCSHISAAWAGPGKGCEVAADKTPRQCLLTAMV